MGEVLTALEGPIVPMVCTADDPRHASACGRTSFCTVNALWVRVKDAITEAVDSLSLADLVAPAGSSTSAVTIEPELIQVGRKSTPGAQVTV
jgi:DNA-binding IscR family transcriptional regulator